MQEGGKKGEGRRGQTTNSPLTGKREGKNARGREEGGKQQTSDSQKSKAGPTNTCFLSPPTVMGGRSSDSEASAFSVGVGVGFFVSL